jgi:hypothetical protein
MTEAQLVEFVTFAASQAAGWFGLAGVALGGILAAGLTLYQDRTRRRRDASKARRLVSSDLKHVNRALTVTEANLRRSEETPKDPRPDDQQWPLGWEKVTWAQSWAGYREALAGSLDEHEFALLATAFGFIEQFQNSLAAGIRPFQSDDAKFLGEVRAAIDEASSVAHTRTSSASALSLDNKRSPESAWPEA